jgi:hypothetical protein
MCNEVASSDMSGSGKTAVLSLSSLNNSLMNNSFDIGDGTGTPGRSSPSAVLVSCLSLKFSSEAATDFYADAFLIVPVYR